MVADFKPISVTIADACRLTGLGRTKLFELIGNGVVGSALVAGRRLISFESLQALVQPTPSQLDAIRAGQLSDPDGEL